MLSVRLLARAPATLSKNVHTSTATTDSLGIPLNPTWSVNELVSSYPTPTISDTTFNRLHKLSALEPPVEDEARRHLKSSLEEVIKLVEAVRLVHIPVQEGIVDGRVSAEGVGLPLHGEAAMHSKGTEGCHGTDLLRHAARTSNGMYVVDADKAR